MSRREEHRPIQGTDSILDETGKHIRLFRDYCALRLFRSYGEYVHEYLRLTQDPGRAVSSAQVACRCDMVGAF